MNATRVRQGEAEQERRELATPRVWLVGDFAASKVGNFSVAEDLERRLRARGTSVAATSRRTDRVARALDMVVSTWRRRRDVDVAVVDVYSGRAFRWAEAVCGVLRRAGVPFVLVLRGGGLPTFAQRQAERVRRLFGAAAAVVALSDYLSERMRAYADDFHVLPNPLDVGAYPFRPREAAAPRLVWLRSFHATYDPEMAPRVLARVRAAVPDATLVMVGPDRGDGTLARTRELAGRLGVTDALTFVGPVPKDRVGEHLARGDVFLNTPRIDNVPISVLEAMACGLCVVSTDVGGMPFLVRDDRDALLVPAGDDQAMAAAVERVCGDPDLAARLSRGGRRVAEAHDWGAVLPRWEQLLADVAGKRR